MNAGADGGRGTAGRSDRCQPNEFDEIREYIVKYLTSQPINSD